MVLAIAGKPISRLDILTDQQVLEILNDVLSLARSTERMDTERETFDFKLNYPPSDNDEIRKDFSSFANSNGGLIIVGIDDSLNIRGISSPPNDVHLRQVLSERNKIRPPPDYVVREITYLGARLVVYHIFETVIPIEIFRRGRWSSLRRYGSTAKEMDNAEIVLKWYRGLPRVPNTHKLQLDSVALYDVNGYAVNEYVEWTTLDPYRLFRLLELSYLPLILIPTQSSILSSPDLYQNTTRWHGESQNITDGLFVELESKIQNFGILSEYWTVPTDRSKTVVEPQIYRTGINAKALQDSIAELILKLRYVNFGWIILSGGISLYILGGHASEKSASVTITNLISFIPNNSPFVHIDQAARVVVEPLPVRPISPVLTKKWVELIPSALYLDVPPEEELSKRPKAKITHYLGSRLEKRQADMPVRSEGLAILSINEQGRGRLKGMISEVNPVLCRFSTLPIGLNDAEEVRIVGQKGTAYLFPHYDFHNFHLVLFDLDFDINQSQTLKM